MANHDWNSTTQRGYGDCDDEDSTADERAAYLASKRESEAEARWYQRTYGD